MGMDKALLPFGKELLLQRVVRRLSESVSEIVVVSNKELKLPTLPKSVITAIDERPEYGPLEGLRIGLKTLEKKFGENAVAFATSCDVPFLSAALVAHLFECSQRSDPPFEIVVPVQDEFPHPLCAVYQTQLAGHIESLQQQNIHRPRALFDIASTMKISVEDLRSIDRDLKSFSNLNFPHQYLAALEADGLICPDEVYQNLNFDSSA